MSSLRNLSLLAALGLALAAALAAPPAAAQPRSDTDRTFALRAVEALFEGEPHTEVNLGGAMLGMVADATGEDDPDLAEAVRDLSGIYVREYALSQLRPGGRERIRTLARDLEGDGWEVMVRTREDDEETFVYTHPRDGMIVISLDGGEGEATFVEMRGTASAAQLGRLGQRFSGRGGSEDDRGD